MIQGSLREAPLADTFQVVAGGRKSGVLTVVRELQRARIHFHRGRIRSAQLTPGTPLGEIMVRLDLLSAREVQELLLKQTSERDGILLGRAALDAALLDEAALLRALERQVADVLDELLTWRAGAFSFAEQSPDAPPLPDGPDFDATRLLMEAAQRQLEFERGSAPPEAIYRRAGDPTRVAMPEGGWEVLRGIDGRSSAAAVAADLELPEARVYRLLFELEQLGVVARQPFELDEPPVLVVAASPTLRRLLRLALQRARLPVTAAADPDAALEIARAERPAAVVVDDEDGAGWRFVRDLRRLPGFGRRPVVVLTDGTGDPFWRRLRRPPAHTLAKPFDELELQRLVTGLLGRTLL